MGHGLKSQLWFWIVLLITYFFVIRLLWTATTIFFGRLWSPFILVDSFRRIRIVTDYPQGKDTIILGCSNLDFEQSIAFKYICRVSNGSIEWLIVWCVELAHLVIVDNWVYSHVDHYIQHLVCSWYFVFLSQGYYWWWRLPLACALMWNSCYIDGFHPCLWFH